MSYMNRVMMLVFPTDWSPRNTSLYLARAETGAITRIYPNKTSDRVIGLCGAEISPGKLDGPSEWL